MKLREMATSLVLKLGRWRFEVAREIIHVVYARKPVDWHEVPRLW
jgi:hypothetical protein